MNSRLMHHSAAVFVPSTSPSGFYLALRATELAGKATSNNRGERVLGVMLPGQG
jgi:hypothetical protein